MELRLAVPSDGPALARIYAPIVMDTSISFEERPPSGAEMSERIARAGAAYPWVVAADETGAVLGYAYASSHRSRAAYRWSIDVSAYVAEGRRGGGVGKRLYGALLHLARAQGFRRAYAGIAVPNEASIALHESVGFTFLAVYRNVGYKHGAWRDVSWWECELAAPSDAAPAEPRDLDEIEAKASIARFAEGRARSRSTS